MEKISGIYCILNLKNNKRYIGKSVNIYNRWATEKSGLRNKYFHNIHLQRAWDKYGEDSFDFFILERCKKDILAEREQFWINFYDSYNNGYNQTIGGEGSLGVICSQEKRQKLRDAHLGEKNFNTRPVYCIELNQTFWGAKEAEMLYGDIYGVSASRICDCCNKRGRYNGRLNDGTTLHWCYESDKDSFTMQLSKNYKPIYCVELDEYFINIQSAVNDSRISKAHNSNIKACCEGNPKHKTCGSLDDGTKLTWRYANFEEIDKLCSIA